jgi:hypothetical protein
MRNLIILTVHAKQVARGKKNGAGSFCAGKRRFFTVMG